MLGLSDRLRSVFVPYFRYLLDPIAAHLGGSAPDAADGPRKKRKKRSIAVAVMGDTSSDPAVVEDTWRLRLKVGTGYVVSPSGCLGCFSDAESCITGLVDERLNLWCQNSGKSALVQYAFDCAEVLFCHMCNLQLCVCMLTAFLHCRSAQVHAQQVCCSACSWHLVEQHFCMVR